jgi:biotin transport system substrate-specific component
VPITGQTFGVLVTGITLGAKRGALSALFYMFEGAMGMPVFAGLKGGLPYLLVPTGGYIMGFVPAAYITGYLAQRGWDRNVIKSALSIIAGNSMIYLFGLITLSFYTHYSNVLVVGLFPFITGDVIKISIAVISSPLIWRVLKWRGSKRRKISRIQGA